MKKLIISIILIFSVFSLYAQVEEVTATTFHQGTWNFKFKEIVWGKPYSSNVTALIDSNAVILNDKAIHMYDLLKLTSLRKVDNQLLYAYDALDKVHGDCRIVLVKDEKSGNTKQLVIVYKDIFYEYNFK